MPVPRSRDALGTILIIGASRGLGHAMATEFLKKGWTVIATVRGNRRTALHELASVHGERLQIEQLDVNVPDEIVKLRERLRELHLDILFVNAGTTNANPAETIAETSTEDFIRVMVTNALSPMRVIETLEDLVATDGMIGVMSSGQGSLTNNTKGGHEAYRGSKAALNQLMRSYAARHADDSRTLLLVAPGWIRTDLGGPDAPFTIEETVPQIVDMLLAQKGKPGLRFLDRAGQTVPW